MVRILVFALFIVALVGLVIVSQYRPEPQFVSGLIEADEIRLGSRVGGRVKSVQAEEGETVSPGDVLVELEPYDLLEREQQAIAQLAERDAALSKLVKGIRPEEVVQAETRYREAQSQLSLIKEGPRREEVTVAENRLNAAQAEYKLAEREYKRQADLAKSNAISKSELDLAEERYTAAASQVKVRQNELALLVAGSREQEIEMAEARLENLRLAWEIAKQGYRDEEIEQARAARNAAQAGLEAIREQKQELTIKSPTSGQIESLDLRPGDLVAPNAPVLSVLAETDLWVRAYVPQRLLQIQVGQQVNVDVDSFPKQPFQGTISFIARQAEFTPSNVQTPDDRAKQVFRIRVTLEDPEQRLRPGMTANVWLKAAGE